MRPYYIALIIAAALLAGSLGYAFGNDDRLIRAARSVTGGDAVEYYGTVEAQGAPITYDQYEATVADQLRDRGAK